MDCQDHLLKYMLEYSSYFLGTDFGSLLGNLGLLVRRELAHILKIAHLNCLLGSWGCRTASFANNFVRKCFVDMSRCFVVCANFVFDIFILSSNVIDYDHCDQMNFFLIFDFEQHFDAYTICIFKVHSLKFGNPFTFPHLIKILLPIIVYFWIEQT